MSDTYFEHSGRAVETDERFAHVMAIALDPRTEYKEGVVRCITSRSGKIGIKGNLDRSELHKVSGDSLEYYEIGERLVIQNEEEVIEQLGGPEWDFIGLEDPDIWIDSDRNLLHLYFTIPLKHKLADVEHKKMRIYLGHAVGKNLDELKMTMPALYSADEGYAAKEVSIAPVNKQGFRYNLFESADIVDGTWFSTVRVAIAHDMGDPWQFGKTVFHPREHQISWVGGHASPGPLLSREFIDVGEGKLLGFMNGREANEKVGDEVRYGMFSVGLFIYDHEQGKIDWVSPEPLIIDSEAKTITFASQFVETEKGKGILYAHVDDSFVRAYTITADLLKPLLRT
ncbi:MAG TPA: hypothetical protein VJB98_00245 [Candidatus Paceibacterota bacterium]